jgi:hypothetical protein
VVELEKCRRLKSREVIEGGEKLLRLGRRSSSGQVEEVVQ